MLLMQICSDSIALLKAQPKTIPLFSNIIEAIAPNIPPEVLSSRTYLSLFIAAYVAIGSLSLTGSF